MSHSMLKKSYSFNGQLMLHQDQFCQWGQKLDQHGSGLSIIKESKYDMAKREFNKKPKIMSSSRIPADFSGNKSCNSRSASCNKKLNVQINNNEDCDLGNKQDRQVDCQDENQKQQTQLKGDVFFMDNHSDRKVHKVNRSQEENFFFVQNIINHQLSKVPPDHRNSSGLQKFKEAGLYCNSNTHKSNIKNENTHLVVNLSQIPNNRIEDNQIFPCSEHNQDAYLHKKGNLHNIDQQRYLMKLQKKKILSAKNKTNNLSNQNHSFSDLFAPFPSHNISINNSNERNAMEQQQQPNDVFFFSKIDSKNEQNCKQIHTNSFKRVQDIDIGFFTPKDQGINYEISQQQDTDAKRDISNQNPSKQMKEQEEDNNLNKQRNISQEKSLKSPQFENPQIHIGQFQKNQKEKDDETENNKNHHISSNRKVTLLKGVSLQQLKEMSSSNLQVSPLEIFNKWQSKQERGDGKELLIRNEESLTQQQSRNRAGSYCNENSHFSLRNNENIQHKSQFPKLQQKGNINQPLKSISTKSIQTKDAFVLPFYSKRPIARMRIQSASFYESKSCNNSHNKKNNHANNTSYLSEVKCFQPISANSSFSLIQRSHQLQNKSTTNVQKEDNSNIKQEKIDNFVCNMNSKAEHCISNKEESNDKGMQSNSIQFSKIQEDFPVKNDNSSNFQLRMNQDKCQQDSANDIEKQQTYYSNKNQRNQEKSTIKFVSSSAISALFFSVSPQKLFPASNSSAVEPFKSQSHCCSPLEVSPQIDSDRVQQLSLNPKCTSSNKTNPNNSNQTKTFLAVKKKWEQFRQKNLQLYDKEIQEETTGIIYHTPKGNKNIKREYQKLVEQLKHNILSNELITIEDISKHISTVLHVPTLQIFILRTFEINESNQKSLNARISFKKSLTEKYPFLFAQTYQIFNNFTERCLSVLTEYLPIKSLKLVSNCFGTINERGLQVISSELIKKFSYMDSFELASLNLSQNNILLDHLGKIKLDCFSRENQNSQRNEMLAFLVKNASVCQFSCVEASTKRKQDGKQLLNRFLGQDNQDCQHYLAVQLGLVLLELSIGEDFLFDYNSLQFSTFQDRSVKKKRSSPQKKQFCFLHEICSDRHELYNEQQTIIFKNILLRKYSPCFADFVCQCLQNSDFSELLNHPFISQQDQQVLQTNSLKELFQVARKFNSESAQNNSEEILNRVKSQIAITVEQFPQFSTHLQLTKVNLTENHPFVDFMLNDLGLSPQICLNYLKTAIDFQHKQQQE